MTVPFHRCPSCGGLNVGRRQHLRVLCDDPWHDPAERALEPEVAALIEAGAAVYSGFGELQARALIDKMEDAGLVRPRMTDCADDPRQVGEDVRPVRRGCPGHQRHWFTVRGMPFVRLPSCVRCGETNPKWDLALATAMDEMGYGAAFRRDYFGGNGEATDG